MITDAEFINIQGHEHTVIQPSEGVTVIKGPSHTSKSSIVRGFKWLFENPTRLKLKSWFAADKDAYEVGVNFKEDTSIIRRKGEEGNIYETPMDILEAVGSDVPQEVKDITNMSAINIQSQHEGYFMLNESPGKVGRELNKIVGLDIINEVFTKCDKLIRKAVSDLAYCEQSIKETEDELKSFDGLDKVEISVKRITKLITDYENIDRETRALSELIQEIKEQEDDLAQLKDWLLIVPKYNELAKMIADYEEKKKELDELEILLIGIVNEQTTLNTLQKWLEIKPAYQELEAMITDYEKLASTNGSLSELCSAISQESKTLKTCHHEIKLSRKAYDQFIKKQKICPLCGGNI